MIAFAVVAASAWAAPPQFTVTPLGNLGGGLAQGFGINDAGSVVGDSTDSLGNYHAFIYSGGSMHALAPDPNFTQAYGINSAGQVAGDDNAHAALYTSGGVQDLGTLGGQFSEALAINANGAVVGDARLVSGVYHAAVFGGASPTDLGTLGGDYSVAWSVNSAGDVAGWATLAPGDGNTHAFLDHAGVMQDLGVLGLQGSEARGINDSDVVVGYNYTGRAAWKAFAYYGGTMHDLGTLGGANSEAYGVNNSGEIVGDSYIASGDIHAFLDYGGTMYDLNSLVTGTDLPDLAHAMAINNNGQIVVNSTANNTAYLLTPTAVPEPFSCIGLGLGLAGLVGARRRSSRSS